MSLSREFYIYCLISVASASLPQYFLVKQSLTWLDAVSYCRTQYTDLVSTLSDMDLMVAQSVAIWNEVWIGLYLCSPSDWRWSNGATGTYTKWNSGQPNENTNACVRISGGKWSDADCGSLYYSVCYKLSGASVPDLPSNCQWPTRPTTAGYMNTTSPDLNNNNGNNGPTNSAGFQGGMSQTSSTMGPSPGQGMNLNNSTGSGKYTSSDATTSTTSATFSVTPTVTDTSVSTGYVGSTTTQRSTSWRSGTVPGYVGSTTTQRSTSWRSGTVPGNLHLVQTPMTWSESRTYCRSYFTDLAAASAPEEQNMMATLLASYTPSQGFWFGLRHNRFWGNWYWSGGQTWGKFIYWGDAEPYGPLSKSCGLISGDPARNFSWSSECCGQQLPFVCYTGEEL